MGKSKIDKLTDEMIEAELARQGVFRFDENGEEIQTRAGLIDNKEYGDPNPMEVPIGMTRNAPNLTDYIRQFVREEVSRSADRSGFETFEESDDFDTGDLDDDPLFRTTPYEELFEPPARPDPPVSKPGEGGKGGEEPSPKAEAPIPPEPPVDGSVK